MFSFFFSLHLGITMIAAKYPQSEIYWWKGFTTFMLVMVAIQYAYRFWDYRHSNNLTGNLKYELGFDLTVCGFLFLGYVVFFA